MTEDSKKDQFQILLQRVHCNLERTLAMLDVIILLDKRSQEFQLARDAAEDIARALVVLLHAILEDLLRETQRITLAQSSTSILSNIPLVGTSAKGHLRKFTLAELSPHSAKSVDQLIQESVDEFLDKKSFSSTADVVKALEYSNIEVSHFREYLPTLKKLILRRHQIVHRADLLEAGDGTQVAPLDCDELAQWATVTISFVLQLLADFASLLGLEDMEDWRQKLSSLLED